MNKLQAYGGYVLIGLSEPWCLGWRGAAQSGGHLALLGECMASINNINYKNEIQRIKIEMFLPI